MGPVTSPDWSQVYVVDLQGLVKKPVWPRLIGWICREDRRLVIYTAYVLWKVFVSNCNMCHRNLDEKTWELVPHFQVLWTRSMQTNMSFAPRNRGLLSSDMLGKFSLGHYAFLSLSYLFSRLSSSQSVGFEGQRLSISPDSMGSMMGRRALMQARCTRGSGARIKKMRHQQLSFGGLQLRIKEVFHIHVSSWWIPGVCQTKRWSPFKLWVHVVFESSSKISDCTKPCKLWEVHQKRYGKPCQYISIYRWVQNYAKRQGVHWFCQCSENHKFWPHLKFPETPFQQHVSCWFPWIIWCLLVPEDCAYVLLRGTVSVFKAKFQKSWILESSSWSGQVAGYIMHTYSSSY